MERSEHFSRNELACKCCGMADMDEAFMERLEDLRKSYNKPMKASSAYRCPEHNAEVSKTGKDGPHTTGRAIDILVSGKDTHAIIRIAAGMGFTGIGIKQKGPHDQRFLHLDDLEEEPGRPRPWVWSY